MSGAPSASEGVSCCSEAATLPQRRRARSDARRTCEQLSSQLLAALTAKRARTHVDLSALAPENLRRACVCLVIDMRKSLAAVACTMCSKEACLGAALRSEVQRALLEWLDLEMDSAGLSLLKLAGKRTKRGPLEHVHAIARLRTASELAAAQIRHDMYFQLTAIIKSNSRTGRARSASAPPMASAAPLPQRCASDPKLRANENGKKACGRGGALYNVLF